MGHKGANERKKEKKQEEELLRTERKEIKKRGEITQRTNIRTDRRKNMH